MQSIEAMPRVQSSEGARPRVGAARRAVLFVVLWLASLAVPIACYTAAADQDATIHAERQGAPRVPLGE